MSDLTNQFIRGYHFQWRIAQGGMATVYVGQRADDPNGPHVALKVLHPTMAANPVVRKRFEREAELGQRLKHRNIVQVFNLVEADGHLFMVMQYLPGGSLADRIEERGALKWMEALAVIKQVGRALEYAHAQGVVHRDVKPSNILFDQYGDAHLADFGVAHEAYASTLTASGFQPGTVAYMSPEQIQGLDVDPRSDQFSLAVVFYRMITGDLPFEGATTAALTYHIVHKPPRRLPRRSDIPKGAQKVLAKAMAKDPTDRYENISAFVKALDEATLAGSGAAIPWKLAAAGLAAVLLLAGGGYLLLRGGGSASAGPHATSRTVAAVVASPAPEDTAPAPDAPHPSPTMPPTPTLAPATTTSAGSVASGLIVDTPEPAPTDTPAAEASDAEEPTPTLVPTPTATPTRRPSRPALATPPPATGGSQAQTPQFSVELLEPEPSFSGDAVTLKWRASPWPLPPGYRFEPVVWSAGDVRAIQEFGMSPTGETDADAVAVRFSIIDKMPPLNLESGRDYFWSVCIVKAEEGPSAPRRVWCAPGRPFRYVKTGGGGGSQPHPTPTPQPTSPPGED